jgi:hypothetical protein
VQIMIYGMCAYVSPGVLCGCNTSSCGPCCIPCNAWRALLNTVSENGAKSRRRVLYLLVYAGCCSQSVTMLHAGQHQSAAPKLPGIPQWGNNPKDYSVLGKASDRLVQVNSNNASLLYAPRPASQVTCWPGPTHLRRFGRDTIAPLQHCATKHSSEGIPLSTSLHH